MAGQILFFLFFGALIASIWYCVAHKFIFDTVQAGTTGYAYSSVYETRYGGTFKVPDYKLKHNDVMFVRAVDNTEHWKPGDMLVVDPNFPDFVKNSYYLFKQGKTYRLVKCTGVAHGMPPIFDGHETLITHECLGHVLGRLNPPKVEVFS